MIAPSAAYDPAECIEPDRLARLFGKSKSWVYTQARQGRIPAVRVGGSWLFPRRLIERWLEASGEVETGGPRGRVDRMSAARAGGARRGSRR